MPSISLMSTDTCPTIEPSELIERDELLRMLRCSERTLRQWVAAKRFPAPLPLPGREQRWSARQVRAYLDRLMGQPVSA